MSFTVFFLYIHFFQGPNDFIMDSYAIGKGSFGFVRLGKNKKNSLTYAIKQTRKIDVCKKKGMKFVLRERASLKSIDNPFIIKLCGSFQGNVFKIKY